MSNTFRVAEMESDHCTGFVDFDENELFGENMEDPTHLVSRKLSTDYPESIENIYNTCGRK